MYSQNADQGYKRMTRTIDLTGVTGSEPANLSFWTSFNTEADWDFVFVEAQTINPDGSGAGDFTTLPDAANGHTSDNTGSSCPAGWAELHPILEHYQTLVENGPGDDDNECLPNGTTGTWNASTGNSGGWQNWSIDLSAYRGKQVEVSIVFATDWGTTTVPGAMIDDTTVTAGSNGQRDVVRDPGRPGWLDDPGPARREPVGERQRLDPVRPDPVRGRRGHGDRLRDDVRLRSGGRERRGQPRRPDGPHPAPPVAVANGLAGRATGAPG